MSDQDIRFRIVVEDAGSAAADRVDRALLGIGQAADLGGRKIDDMSRHLADMGGSSSSQAALAYTAALRGQADAYQRLGVSQGQYTNALRMLPAQFSDVATQLAGGQSPLLVLTQQGLQTRDMFGSFRAAGQGLLSIFTPMRVLGGSVAAVLAAIGYGAYQGYEQTDKLNKAMVASGNAAGVTRGQLDGMVHSVANISAEPIGKVRDVMYSLAGSGVFVGQQLELAGRASLALARLTGQGADQIAKDLQRMSGGVTDYVVSANRSYNFLTVEVYRQIKSLEAHGKSQEAVTLALRELAATAEARVPQSMNKLDRVMQEVTATASRMWKQIWGLLDDETPEQRVDKATKKLAELRAAAAKFPGGVDPRPLMQAETKRQLQEQAAGQEDIRRNQKKAEADAKRAADVQKEIGRDQSGAARAELEAQLALEAAFSQRSLAQFLADNEARQRAFERVYEQRLITTEQFETDTFSRERSRAAKELELAEAEVNRAGRRPAKTPAEEAQRSAAVVTAGVKLLEARARQAKLEADIQDGKFNAKPREVLEDPTTAFRLSEIAQNAQLKANWDQRRAGAEQNVREILGINRDMSLSLIQDDRARGYAQIDLEEQQMRKRVDLAVMSVEERQAAEEAFAQWRVLREQQLTEQLKPQWQRDAELWADTTRDMRARYDEFLSGFVDSGREAFAEFVKTGRLSTTTLTGFIRGEFAKMAYERFLSSYVRQAGNFLFNTLLGSGSGGGSGMPDDVPTRGGRAFGGGADAYTAYTVGERGPEKLVMGRNPGVVIPNNVLTGAASSGGINLTQNFYAKGNEDLATMYRMANMARDSAIAGVAEARRRGSPAFVGG